MSSVLVTGGAGFIGSHLIERLLSLGHAVVCLDNFDSYYPRQIKEKNLQKILNAPQFLLVEGDIRHREGLEKLFSEHRFDRVFHGAARAGVRPSIQDPFLYEDVNIRGTLNLLKCAVEHRIGNLVFSSSSSVYGNSSKIPFSEEDPAVHPISPYAATKRACELICYNFHHLYGLPVTCLRFFTVYGPRQRPDMAINKFVRRMLKGQPVPFYGQGDSLRDYTYIDDAVDGIVAALERAYPFEIINIGEAQTITLSELIALLERQLGVQASLQRLPPQPGDVAQTWADLEKARRLLDYGPRTDIREGIQRFIQWYRNEGTADLCESW